ncbi:acetate--CoA ligase family protein [Limibaculum sp. M0105]|uniref:Acetate--CoA ligase family protein n=1 Tax=Thermohalobaculum xanthum TaxID=2753746 RepID=A0A8J7SHS4_9RHOB|nr:acetate--CoA ligase family protein [Thermohalobaculum xanthum]MBK0399890.1 acetate--CoA ligase family protein [Thermohalobaculum xanthum]
MTADHPLRPLFNPRSIAFVGGSNLRPALRYHRDQGFAGPTYVVNAKHESLGGYPCTPSIEDLPEAPDLAFIAIRREAAIEAIAALRTRGCRAVVCNAAGFAELGDAGTGLQADYLAAVGDMAALGPNSIGLANFADPMAAMMDHFGVAKAERGVAIVSQGGGLLCDVVFADRGLRVTHLVGCGNQAKTTVADCLDYMLDDPRVSAVGLTFEGLPDTATLRRAAVKALRLGKPIVAFKLGRSAAGSRASASHTASMTGAGAAWDALFDRLGIVTADSESTFIETLKLFDSGQVPKGRRVLVTAASGMMGIMLADHLSAAGFEMPQPGPSVVARLRELLPGIATPGNPQDITMAAWNDLDRQRAIYSTLLEEDYDIAMMLQNYPREGMWDITEYAAQVDAIGAACQGRPVVGMQVAPLADCFPAHARLHTESHGLAAMQGLEECMAALKAAVTWRERRTELLAGSLEDLERGAPAAPANAARLDEAEAKALIAAAGVPVPASRVAAPEGAARAASGLGFPVALKALDARLLHKTEAGAVRLGLRDEAEVEAAIAGMRADMARLAPEIPLSRVLVERMAPDVVAEVMASVSLDPVVGPLMMIAGGGVEAELWGDSTLLAFPATRTEIERALDRLKVSQRIAGWRGRPPGDRAALVDALLALARLAEDRGGMFGEIEINPILVGREGVLAVDAVMTLARAEAQVA